MSGLRHGDGATPGPSRGSPLERLDPRATLLTALITALWIGLLPPGDEALLVPLVLGLLAVGALARCRPAKLLWRASASLPFVALPAALGLLGGRFEPEVAAGMAGRGFAAAMVAALLVAVTPLPALLHGASSLGLPDVLVQTIALVLRFVHVLQERAAAMARSARARGWGRRTPQRFTVAGAMLGALVVQSFDRAERVHASMLARGCTGRRPVGRPLRARPIDWLVPTGLAAVAAGSLAWLR